MSSQYHLESKESIEAILVTEPDASVDEAPTFPSFCFIEPSPICVGFHEESLSCSPSPDCAWKKNKPETIISQHHNRRKNAKEN